MNLLIIGHGRHGKNTAADILHDVLGLIVLKDCRSRPAVQHNSQSDADLIIQNNETKEEFYKKIVRPGNQSFNERSYKSANSAGN